jgi:hypothetical protein
VVTGRDGDGPPALPVLPSRGGKNPPSSEIHAQSAQRARVREDTPERNPGTGHRLSLPAVTGFLAGLFTIGQLWASQPPSLAMAWHHQAGSVSFYRNRWMKAARWCWAPVALSVAAAMYLIQIATATPARALLAAGGLVLAVHFL